ncbi:unnamed protein product [Fusarium graminearum]|uniref:Chromosome 2, complete genome n=1 Tax=Gibberella zeae (strain ATCC MYA-4620 / CBS 123657 / FGSC 9075 / NRRL 31084 / PH-1) TaxID=229533 RepID=I1S661_GIBZE|nr:hypothetical protein FGSG_12332 [Fusarium graminearum PH-1]ESU09156.1 hypothetical protein FGSG_12332 [Fusarium graminearum PH-1]CEF78917.1 unnamed protein product [Fusarium graminearum]CZS82209.1 unnamed protein product [Fusarium graminearum]|eukprot:XP_011321655.1 hypothetical protein FGSG_12332 [Fusarium graminearum PH-1]
MTVSCWALILRSTVRLDPTPSSRIVGHLQVQGTYGEDDSQLQSQQASKPDITTPVSVQCNATVSGTKATRALNRSSSLSNCKSFRSQKLHVVLAASLLVLSLDPAAFRPY